MIVTPKRRKARRRTEFGLSAGCDFSSQFPTSNLQLPSAKRPSLEVGLDSGRWKFGLDFGSWTLGVRPLSVYFLLDPVLFQLLVEIAARRVERLRGLRDVPVVFAQLLHQERALGGLLELAQRTGRRRRAARRI